MHVLIRLSLLLLVTGALVLTIGTTLAEGVEPPAPAENEGPIEYVEFYVKANTVVRSQPTTAGSKVTTLPKDSYVWCRWDAFTTSGGYTWAQCYSGNEPLGYIAVSNRSAVLPFDSTFDRVTETVSRYEVTHESGLYLCSTAGGSTLFLMPDGARFWTYDGDTKTATVSGTQYLYYHGFTADGTEGWAAIGQYGQQIMTPLAITVQPQDLALWNCDDTIPVPFVEATGDALTYTWWEKLPGDTDFSINNHEGMSHYYGFMDDEGIILDADWVKAYCVITDKYGASVQSDPFTIMIRQPWDGIIGISYCVEDGYNTDLPDQLELGEAYYFSIFSTEAEWPTPASSIQWDISDESVLQILDYAYDDDGNVTRLSCKLKAIELGTATVIVDGTYAHTFTVVPPSHDPLGIALDIVEPADVSCVSVGDPVTVNYHVYGGVEPYEIQYTFGFYPDNYEQEPGHYQSDDFYSFMPSQTLTASSGTIHLDAIPDDQHPYGRLCLQVRVYDASWTWRPEGKIEESILYFNPVCDIRALNSVCFVGDTVSAFYTYSNGDLIDSNCYVLTDAGDRLTLKPDVEPFRLSCVATVPGEYRFGVVIENPVCTSWLPGGTETNLAYVLSVPQFTLPANLTTIAEEAFENSGINGTLVIPAGVTCVERNAFAGCNGITAVVVMGGNTRIESGAFPDTVGRVFCLADSEAAANLTAAGFTPVCFAEAPVLP